jgi:hypothetical protein
VVAPYVRSNVVPEAIEDEALRHKVLVDNPTRLYWND